MIYIRHMKVVYEEPPFGLTLDPPFTFRINNCYADLKLEMTGPLDEIQALALKLHEWYRNPGGRQNNPWPEPEPEPASCESVMDKLPEDSPIRLEDGPKELLQLPPGPDEQT